MSFARCLVLPLVAGTVLFGADVILVDQIIAKVNGDIVTASDIDRQRKNLQAELKQRGAKDDQIKQVVAEREKDILKDKIDQMLLVQKAKELNINVDQQFSKYQADLMKQFKVADQDKFQSMVREQTGTPYEDWRNDIKNTMLTQRVIGQEVQSKIDVPSGEVQKYYEEHKTEFVREEQVFLQEIFLKMDGKNDAAVEKKAKDLVARAKKGEKFHELARDNSDSESAQNGGDIGGVKKGGMDPALEKIVFTNGKNFVTDPIRRPNGFLILKIAEVHQAGQAPFEAVEGEVKDRLYRPKMEPAMKAFMTQLREQAFLEIRSGFVDTGAAPGKDTAWTDPAQLKPETVSKEELAKQKHRKRFLGVPMPGTSTSVEEKESKGTSASKALKPKKV